MLGLHNVILVATVDSVNPDNPTTENSIDQLNENMSAENIAGTSYAGSGGDELPECPPACS